VDHVPLYLESAEEPPEGGGWLCGHIPRANPLSEVHVLEDVLAIFHGPECYISPSSYPTKAETGRVVPTWNYQVVHARGRLRVVDDPDWVLEQVSELTRRREAGRADPWQVSDAPPEFVAALVERLVGIEIAVSSWTGKTKASQNQPLRNRAGVEAALRRSGSGRDREMAALVRSLTPSPG